MNTLLKILIGLAAILFILIGVRWAVDPSGAAAFLGMPLLEGLGLSSQIGDIGAAFLGMGLMMMFGLVSQKPTWFYAPAMLLAFVAGFRLIAWLLHGAVFAGQQIMVEVVVAILLIIAASRARKENKN